MRIPPTVINLVWILAANSFSMKLVLHSKHVQVDLICLRCGMGIESLNHVFKDCPISMEI